MRSAFLVSAALVMSSGCLLRDNPEFGTDETTSTSTSATTNAVEPPPTGSSTLASATTTEKTSTDDATSSETGTTSTPGSSSGAVVCEDEFETNDDESASWFLGPVMGAAPPSTLSATNGSLDEWDWYRYRLTNPTPPFNPSASTTGSQRICVYVECVTGPTEVLQCGDPGTEEVSPDGRSGCCSFGQARTQYRCMSDETEVEVYIGVGSNGATTCDAYDLRYRGAGLL